MTRICDCGDKECLNYLKDCFSLVYDEWGMEGGILEFGDGFEHLDSLSQADLLKDWIELLTTKYNSVTGDDFLSDIGRTEMNDEPPSGAIN
jgi:hypothetical protein